MQQPSDPSAPATAGPHTPSADLGDGCSVGALFERMRAEFDAAFTSASREPEAVS